MLQQLFQRGGGGGHPGPLQPPCAALRPTYDYEAGLTEAAKTERSKLWKEEHGQASKVAPASASAPAQPAPAPAP